MRFLALAAVLFAAVLAQPASADPAPASPTPLPSPSPSPTPIHGMRYSGDGFVSFGDVAQAGPGLVPPEAPGFIAGAPLAPMTPYDTFSSAPLTPGVAGVAQFNLRALYSGRGIKASATLGLGYAGGSMQAAMYWTESLLPSLNPHLGAQALPYQVAFPTHAGQDDGHAARLSLLSGSIGAPDDSLVLRGGWFDLAQTDKFVFVQPALTNATPSIGLQTAETLGNGPPALDAWPAALPGLPLNGLDLVARRGIASLELSNAALPALPGTSARVTIGSLVFDHGEGTRWSAEVAHVSTGGALLSSTMFGANAMTHPGPQGPLPTSDLGGQQQTLAGLRGAFHAARSLDAIVELGIAWYDAQNVLRPGTQSPGGFYHLGLTHPFGRAAVAADLYRFGPRFATVILPYGVPENVWSVAWSWPGQWLKSTYQVDDNTAIGANRQGFRLRYSLDKGPIEIHAGYSHFDQIVRASLGHLSQVGFVEGFFLPQFDDSATAGVQHQYALWTAWHPSFGDVTLDYVNDTMHRNFLPAHPEDAVSYQAPQVVLTYSRPFGKRALGAVGYGRYAMRGSWAFGALTNVDYHQNVAFVGAQFAESPRSALLVQVRQTTFTGLPSQPGGPSPNFSGSLLVVEQRYHI
ncbi:MAG TPA: hypothetical protein VN934_04170 [Candidatus Tumulicola sp.]|nr:hypothetical protein [Candidatus Tumulicola sp.]